MEELEIIIQKAALLHDIGKVCLRADLGLGNHSKAGVEFLKPYFAKRGDAVLRAVGHHHSGDIKSSRI